MGDLGDDGGGDDHDGAVNIPASFWPLFMKLLRRRTLYGTSRMGLEKELRSSKGV